jgi:hypothetical protein
MGGIQALTQGFISLPEACFSIFSLELQFRDLDPAGDALRDGHDGFSCAVNAD